MFKKTMNYQGNQGGPSNTDDEDDSNIDDDLVNDFINESNGVNFTEFDRTTLYKIILIGDKLIKSDIRYVLTRIERGIMYIWYHVILYYIYRNSSQENKSKNIRNFLILLKSKREITGVKFIERHLIDCAILIDHIDLFCIILSYISRDHEVDFYTEIISSCFIKYDTKLDLLEEFWTYMNLDTKYSNLTINILSKNSAIHKKAMVHLIDLRLIAGPNIKSFLLCKFALLKSKYIQEKEKLDISKKRQFANDADDTNDAESNSKIAKFE